VNLLERQAEDGFRRVAMFPPSSALLLVGIAFTDDLERFVSVEGRFHSLNLFRFSHFNHSP
jgi:hypothetical protein